MATACVCTGIRYCHACKDDRTGNRFPLRPAPKVVRRGRLVIENGVQFVHFGSRKNNIYSIWPPPACVPAFVTVMHAKMTVLATVFLFDRRPRLYGAGD
eukprot:GEMP01161063.1.p1 GENE.GEMP01161063.1~~GEMP01161063.1.p1  ORF type:complete len:108 (+),score=14.72 GEMP01161063.1:28-324(+)